MLESHSPEFLAIINDLKGLRRQTLGCRDELQRAHPAWPPAQDARLTVFAKTVNTINVKPQLEMECPVGRIVQGDTTMTRKRKQYTAQEKVA